MTKRRDSPTLTAKCLAIEALDRLYRLVGPKAVLLPIERGVKGPRTNGWQKTKLATTESEQYRHRLLLACQRGGNVGVLLGPPSSGLVTVDIDDDSEVKRFLALNPKLRKSLRTRGKKGCQIWLQMIGDYPAQRIASKKKCPDNPNKSVGEWRGGNGHQSIIDGIHPDTRGPYQKLVKEPPLEIAFTDINWPEDWKMSFDGEKRAAGSGATKKAAGPAGARAAALPPELVSRILRYIERVDQAISGKGGSNPTYRLANVLVHGFGLSIEQARPFMEVYSLRCNPPWSSSEITHKLEDASSAEHGKPRGHLRKDDWEEEPKQLKGELRPVIRMKPEMLPESLRPWITDTAKRMQCPLDFVACGAIVAASAVIGAGCSIRPKKHDDWAVVPNLWGAVIARPGLKKSPAIKEAFEPLCRLEGKAREEYEATLTKHAAAAVAFEAKRKAIKAEMEKAARDGEELDTHTDTLANLAMPEVPVRRRFMTSDTSIEKAGELMKENPRGLMILRDELVGLLVQWDREDRREDRSFHLQGWNGYGGYTADRIGRGTIDTPQLCESLFGGMQPAKLLSYAVQAKGHYENDGLLQRFQVAVYPDELGGDPVIVDEIPDVGAREIACMVFSNLAKMDFVKHGAGAADFTKIPFFHFDPEAQAFFNEWWLALERKRRAEGENVILEHLSKYDSLMPSLALIFYLLEVAYWEWHQHRPPSQQLTLFPPPPEKVSLRHAEQAAAWCDYLESHAQRIYGLAADASVQAAKKLLRKCEEGQLAGGFTLRDVYRSGWAFLDSKEMAQAALDELVDAGWLREIPSPKPLETGGRPPSPTYRIHPQIFKNAQKGERQN